MMLYGFSPVLGQTYTNTGLGSPYTNHYSSYTLKFDIGGGMTVPNGQGVFVITFNSATSLPATMDPSDITLDGVHPSSSDDITIAGRQIEIVTPQTFSSQGNFKNQDVELVFLKSAKIRNPESPGSNFSVEVDVKNADKNKTKNFPISDTYSINATNTQISKAAVTPDPSVEQRLASYTIGFSVGSGGFLTSNQSTIHIDFPAGTVIPNGSIEGVEVNGTLASTNGDSTQNKVTIETPVNIDNDGDVNIEFGPASGLKNPSTGSQERISENVTIYTSSETTPVTSDNYVITSAQELSSAAVTVVNDTANAKSKYNINFYVSGDDPSTNPIEGGPLNTVNGDLIYVTFRGSTKLPASISKSDVSVTNVSSGFSGDADDIFFEGDTTAVLETPVDIDEGQEVKVSFKKGAGIQNPAPSGNYKIKIGTKESNQTTVIDSSNTSNPYSIVTPTTGVSQASVSLSDRNVGASSDYTLDFSTGDYGRLLGGSSSIFVVFPEGTGIGASSATVNGVTSSSLNQYDADGSDLDTLEIQVPAGVNIGNSSPVTLQINGITNTGEQGNYNLGIYTSVEPTLVNSQSVNIGGKPVTPTSTTLGTNTANSVSSYHFVFTDATSFGKGPSKDYIQVQFPQGTRIPTDITLSDINVVGVKKPQKEEVQVDSANRVITYYVEANKSDKTLEIRFNNSAGIVNPSVPAADHYKALISTSRNTQPVSTSIYPILAHSASPSVQSVKAFPRQKDATDVTYQIAFKPGGQGRLDGDLGAGSDTITVVFDNNGTVLPGTINANEVTVEGETVPWAQTRAGSGSSDTLSIEMPDGLTISGNQEATISINSTAGLDHAGNSGTYTLKMKTTTETGLGSADYDLLKTINLSFLDISKSNSVTNAPSAYTITFSTGTGGALTAGSDNILITFPENTHLPQPLSNDYVRVEGTRPSVNPAVNGQQLSIQTPVDIREDSEVTVQISSNASILNPSKIASNYTLTLATSQENGSDAVESPKYSTTTATSTISNPQISLSDKVVGNTASYEIDFVTGRYGRLIEAGSSLPASTITVRFPPVTSFSNSLSATVNTQTVPNISRDDNVVTFTVPDVSPERIWNEDDVNLNISGIINPTLSDEYEVEIKTSVEPTYINSHSYSITDAAPISVSNLSFSRDTVNQYCDYQFDFTTDSLLESGTSTVTMTFPESSEIPQRIDNSAITIESNSVSKVSTVPVKSRVTVTVPQDIPANTTATLAIDTASGITNPKEPGTNYNLNVYTSKQPAVASLSIGQIYASDFTYISNLGVQVSPKVKNQPTNWTIGFRTGELGAMDPGRARIYLDLDQSVFNEDPIPRSAITVNNKQVSGVNRTGSELELTVPRGATIKTRDTVTVVIDEAAGIEVDPSFEFSKARAKASSGGAGASTQATNNYTVRSSPEPSTTSTTVNPLPIELAEASVQESSGGEEARLTWKTATEYNNYRFYIDRRYLGESEPGSSEETEKNWNEIGHVEGAGTTNKSQSYSYTDNTLEKAGLYEYRIRQVDYDNSSTIYGPYEFKKEAPEAFKLKANYPNPFNPTTTIPYTIPEEADVTIQIYNVIGKRVQTLVNSRQQAGTYRVIFHGGSLSSGTYFIRFEAAGRSFVRKMLLLK